MRRRAHSGLTLLELTVVMAVLVVLAALAIPNFGARAERQRLQGAAQMLATDIAEARFEAARRGLTLHVQATAGTAWCWAIVTVPGCACGQAQTCELRHVRAADHKGVKLLESLLVHLDATGAVQAREATTLESSRGERLRVEVSTLGRARICAETGSWPGLSPC